MVMAKKHQQHYFVWSDVPTLHYKSVKVQNVGWTKKKNLDEGTLGESDFPGVMVSECWGQRSGWYPLSPPSTAWHFLLFSQSMYSAETVAGKLFFNLSWSVWAMNQNYVVKYRTMTQPLTKLEYVAIL